MTEPKRGFPAWIALGSVAMALLSALGLGATVLVAQRALGAANDVVARGEADSVAAAVAADLMQEDAAPPTQAVLDRELAQHAGKGLRYVAIVERGGGRIVEAGKAKLTEERLFPGQAQIASGRVRVAAVLPPRLHRIGMMPGPPALLMIELEPPMIASLRADLARISVVATVTGAVLLAFSLAWARSARRLDAVERRAEREQRLVALGSMSSVMAHELRNPLASLKGHAQLLVEDLADDKQRKKAERVVAEAVRLEVLTTSLLDFVRDGPIERVETDAGQLVALALEHLDRARIDVVEELGSLRIDAPRLGRAIHNLVDNALKASDGRVELKLAQVGSDVVITVRDHGPGLPSEPIFEPFVTTRVRGTGLGLPVARRIAEQHGGTLTGENHPAGGAVFELRFPRDSA